MYETVRVSNLWGRRLFHNFRYLDGLAGISLNTKFTSREGKTLHTFVMCMPYWQEAIIERQVGIRHVQVT